MDEQLHIIIAGHRGKVIRLPLSRRRLWLGISLTLIISITLIIASTFTVALFTENRTVNSQLSELREQLRTSAELIAESKRINDEEQLKLNLKIAKLELNNVKQAVAFKVEKESLLNNTINELTERSELIEKMIDSIGVEIPVELKSGNSNKGGIFVEQSPANPNTAIKRADKFLKAIQYLPFGRPVDGPISSGFGKRSDPVNGKPAFHTGIDFRSKPGDEIYATADGVVFKAYYNGGYGNYVVIDHKNGYATSFSHLKKFEVHAGQLVHRGDLIGYVGDSGRTTGPHLHYEVTLDDEPINPFKFMKVASSPETSGPSSETH
jgi:murein DD-endopeptidase MepM/ murein hydrolase activator NlpD